MSNFAERYGIKEIEWKDFLNLKENDIVYVVVEDKVYKSRVVRKPFYNADADEPDWEVETTNGFCDVYSLCVAM